MSEIDTGARTVYGEARGEPLIGKIGVAHVIMNRVVTDLWNDRKGDWWGEGVEQVCKKTGQFDCWKTTDKNFWIIGKVDFSDRDFAECHAIFTLVWLARNGRAYLPRDFTNDPTFGSCHYKRRDIPWPKDWGPVRASTVELGNHSFYAGLEPGSTPIPYLGTINDGDKHA